MTVQTLSIATATHPVGARQASKLMWFFAFVYIAEGLAQISGILHQPVYRYFMGGLGWSSAEVSDYLLVLGFPWYFKWLYGLTSDCLPLFGYRRKSYLFLFNFATTVALVALTATTSPRLILAELFVIVTGMATSSALCGGLLVQYGKASGLAGKFCSQQTLFVNLSSIFAGLAGGFLCNHFLPAGALHWAALIAMIGPLLVVLSTYHLVEEEKEPTDWTSIKHNFKEGFKNIGSVLSSRSMWAVGGFLFLWAFNPGFGAPMYDHMTKHLHFDDETVGKLAMFYSIGAACGGFIYMKVLTGRYKVGTLAAALILVGASVQALFVYMSDYHTGIALNLANGFVTAMALLNAHVIAANRCPDHAEGFMYSILLSIANISFSTSQWLGAHLYDEHFGKQIEPLILLSAGLTFLCVFMVPFLNFEKQASTAAKAEVKAEA